ncbi:MAG TPA: class I SAM-dependent methyltransferase, partial [Acetobacteraceae bacterium]|nr:class I SAM-dependent methyltransferase [Acetobacteraceae bacterium]
PGHDDGARFEADVVVCSALLDLVSAAWLALLCDTLTVPLLACLTIDGRDVWRPHHPLDTFVRTAFRRDMRRDKGFGPALGTTAPHALAVRGLVTASAPSDWHIPRTALRMQRALIDGTADAARNARPAHADAITAWQEARLRQALRGRLAITIGHRDILVLPPGG